MIVTSLALVHRIEMYVRIARKSPLNRQRTESEMLAIAIVLIRAQGAIDEIDHYYTHITHTQAMPV